MTCRSETRDLLPFYAAGTLGESQRPMVEAHLRDCPDCRAELALWQHVGSLTVESDLALPQGPERGTGWEQR